MLEREGQERARLGASVRELARGIPGLGQRMRRARRPLLFSIAYGMTGSLSSRERARNEVREEPCAAGVRVEVWVVDSQLEAYTARRRHKRAQQSIDLVDGEARLPGQSGQGQTPLLSEKAHIARDDGNS